LFYGPIIERVLYQNDLKLLITNELIDLEWMCCMRGSSEYLWRVSMYY
jgi:hypothetical protein